MPTANRCFTVADVLSWEPCDSYDEARITELWAGRESLTALDILALDIPISDRFWAVLRPEAIDEATLRALACDFAERALNRERDAGREPDPRSWKAIEVARAYARGEASNAERRAAWAAARDAARSAEGTARDAAWAAAWAAARAARAAAWAAREAAWAAAGDAWDAWAARDAEESWRLQHVITTLETANRCLGFRAEFGPGNKRKVEAYVPESRMRRLEGAVPLLVEVLDSLTPTEADDYETRLTDVLRRVCDVVVTHDVAWCLSPYCDKRVAHGGDYCDDDCALANSRENEL